MSLPDIQWLHELEERWGTKTGLALALLLVTATALAVFAADFSRVATWQWVLLVVVLIAAAAAWWLTRFPQVPNGKIGFGVAIEYEGAESATVRSDFSEQLRNLIQSSEALGPRFHFIEFNRRLTKRFLEDGDRNALAQRLRCHFVLYGRAKRRMFSDGPAHFVELHGIVLHAKLDAERAKRFEHEFGRVLPGAVQVADPDSVLAFGFAAAHIDVVARYVMGTAAGLSGDMKVAEEILLDAKNRIERISVNVMGEPLATLKQKIRLRLGEMCDALLTQQMNLYTWRRDISHLEAADQAIVRRRTHVPDAPHVNQCAAMCAFLLRRDIPRARKELEGCRTVNDGGWRYGDAFLSAYEADLDGAYRKYRQAFAAPLMDQTVPTQCEEFIQIVLETEPGRYWLFFPLGLINYRAKGDLVAAKGDFDRFLALVEAGRFQAQVTAVRTWVREIDELAR